LATLLSLLGPLAAHAQVTLGAGVGLAVQGLDCAAGAAPCSSSQPALRLAAGWAFSPAWQLEALALLPTAFTASRSDAQGSWSGRYAVNALGLAAGWSTDLGDARVRLQAGLVRVHAGFSRGTAGAPDASDTRVEPILGLHLGGPLGGGTRWRFGWEQTRSRAWHHSGALGVATLGLEQRF
jgi:hypothetical protein